jgi:hypothetical protein
MPIASTPANRRVPASSPALPAAQAARREEVLGRHRAHCRAQFHPDGRPVQGAGFDRRGWLWQALAFLGGDEDDLQLGNALVARAIDWPNGGGRSHFWFGAASSGILGAHGLRRPGRRSPLQRVRAVDDEVDSHRG